jgi:F0F1-type ATP synthase membrane subunit c/vacuolar-type H+-ATPase subunit K
MNKNGIIMIGTLAFLALGGWFSPAFAQAAAEQRDWAPLIAKMTMGFGLTLALTGSAMGLTISFQALLAGGTDNFYKNIAVALMPATQGIYGMVVFITNMDKFAVDPYTVAGKAMIAGLTLCISAWYQGIVCAAGIKSILEGKNTLANALVSGAMPETYAVFALVMTFVMK